MEKKTLGDIAHSATKAILNSVPYVGGAATEIFTLLVASPIEKRRDIWMKEVGERLLLLETNNNLDLNQLQQNELFIDVVLHTTQSALRTSSQLKRQCYQNILLNSATVKSIDDTQIQIFINLINSFTDWHIRIIELFNNPTEWFKRNSIVFPPMLQGSLTDVLTTAYPVLKDSKELCSLIWSDLHRSGLFNTPSIGGLMSGNGLMANRTTILGQQFLEYIKSE